MKKFKFLFKIALRYLLHRPAATTITIIAVSISLMFLAIVGTINFSLKKSAAEGAIRYPLVIGSGASSGLQIVMSSVFHIDKPSGTIPFSVFEKVSKDPRTLAAYPIAVADSLEGSPIIGTNEEFLKSLNARLIAGDIDLSKLENAVLGYAVAKKTGLRTGDTFKGSHGMVGGEDAHEHEEITYVVKAILSPVNGPEDSAIYTNYKTVWEIHKDKDGDHEDHEEGEEHEEHEQHKGHDHNHVGVNTLTAVLVKTRNPVFTGQLEREYSEDEGLQAVDTGRTVKKLIGYLNKAEVMIELFNTISLAVVIMMIFVTIIMSLNERRRELALMRSLGVGRVAISCIIMIEALVLTLAGAVAGVILSHVALWWAKFYIDGMLGTNIDPMMTTGMESNGIIITLAAGQMLALASMMWVYRMNLVEEIAGS